VIGGDDAYRHDMSRRHDNGVRRHGDHWVEIAGSKSIGEVAKIVREEGMDEGKIGTQSRFKQVVFSIHFDPPLALFHDGAYAGGREDPTKPEAAGADALNERALRHENA
jgi:hypothetical protein